MVWETIVNFFKAVGTAVINYAKANPIRFGFELTTLAVGVKGFLQGRQMLAKGQDIMANKVAAGGKLPIIYGTRRVGAQIVYMDTSSNSSQHLFVVYALSVGEVDEILLRTLEIDGNPLTDPNQFRNGGYLGSDKISSGAGSLCTANQTSGSVDLAGGTFGTNPAAGGYRYVFNAHHGAATQSADPMLRASIGSSWTTSHQLNGVAYIAASFIYDSKGQFSGVPQITVQVKGKKVYDQRKDSTNGGSGSQRIADVSTYEYSDNPAIIFQDFILNDEFGKGLTSSQLNLSTFTTAANKADALVNQPYYNGVAKTFVWSGTSGDNFIVVDPSGSGGLRWWQNKVGEAFYLTASDSTLVLDGTEVQITAVERTHYPGQGVRLLIYFNDTLTSTYSNQTDGSALAKVRRFHCNGYVDGNKTVMENAKELLANMRGIFLYIDGKYELSIEDTGSSTFTITDDHIISDSGISVDYGNKDKKANKVIIEYFNANKKYELDTATVLHDASPEYYSDDGEILEIKAEFPFVTDPYIAYNMGKAILTRSRNQTTMRFLGTPEMYKLNVGDIVTLVYTPLGFTGKFCRVEGIELLPDGLVAVSLIEYFDVYTWEVPPQEDFEELSDIPSAYNVKKPTNITFTDTDASATNRPFLSWDLPTDYPYHQWRVNVVDSSSNQVLNKIVDINNVDLSFIPKANGYVASITALNSLGVESDAETKTFNVGDAPTATDDLQDGSVTNVKIDTLSAAKINTGELNLGQESGMAVRQTKTGYTSTATGFWLGNDGGTPKFNIGTSTNYLKFDGSDLDIAGEISATTGSIGGFTVGATSLTAGSGTSKISLSTADGIHLGANAFADAPFSVNLAGSLTAQSATLSGTIKSNQSFSSGSSTRTVKIDASSNALYTLTAGSATPTEAPFRIKSDGTVEIFKLDLFLSDGVTKIFDADTGFTNNAFSEIAADLGTAISDYTVPLASNTEAQKITLTSTQNITVKAIKSAYMVGWSPNSSSYAKSRIPTNVRMRLMHSTNADLSSANELATLGSSWTAGVDRIDTGTPTANQYEIEEIVETETGFTFYEWVTLNQSGDAIDDNFDFTISSTASYAGSESGTDHYFFIEIDGTGGSTFGANSTTSTAARSLNISGVSFYISNGDASDTGEGDITAVNAGTNLTGGGTSGSVTLNLASTILGNHTFSNNLIVSGDLTVQGTTTTIDTANLNVEDNNITINYSSGDSSASANGAGITIQDAVSAGNDATLTWNTSNDSFNFSHPVNVTGNIGVTGTVDGRDIATDGSKLDGIESGATTDQTQSEINALGITAIGLSGTPNITVGTINSGAITADDITINGSTISDGADLTLDVGADLTLDVAGGDVRFKGSSGSPNATIGTLSMTDDNFTMASSRTNYDIVFKGNDDGSTITALTLDMSDAGTAIFNHDVKLGDNDIAKFGASDDLQIFHDQPNSINYIKSYTSNELRLESNGNTTIRTNNGDDMAVFTKNGAATLYHDNNPKIATTSTGVTVTGNVTATAFYGDGSNLTGVTSTTINNNADNRIITGSGTANTLNAESGLTYDGSTLSGANIQMTGNINASGVTANNVSGNVLKIDSTTVVDNSRNLTNIGTISTSGQITQTVAGSNYFRSIASATGNAGLFMRNTARDWYILNNSVGTLELYDGTASAVRMSINTSGNTTFSGTISSGAITTSGALNFTSATSYVRNQQDASGQIEISALNSSSTARGVRWDAGNDSGGAFRPETTAISSLGLTNRIWDNLFVNTIKIGSSNTTVIDSSRNLTNIGNITASGSASAASVTVDNITIDGSAITAGSANDLTIDAVGDIILDADGDVGIGVTPATNSKLTIGGTKTSYSSVLSFDNNTAGGASFFMLASDNTWNAGSNKFFMGHGAPSSAAVDMTIDADGKVGIGTTSPAENLSIAGSANTGMNIQAGTSHIAFLDFGDSGDTNFGGINYNNADDTLNLRAGNSNRLTINSSGNVEIGISSTNSKLSVLDAAFFGTTNSGVVVGDNGGIASVYGMNAARDTYKPFEIRTGSSGTGFYQDTSGNVGIGGSPVGAKLQVQADGISVKLDGTANTTRSIFFRNTTSSNPAQIYSDGSLRLFTEDAGTDIRFHTNSNGTNNERLRIDASGAMQIGGTTNAGFIDFDSQKLQLNTQRNPNTGAFVNTSRSHASIELNGADGGSSIIFRTAASNNTTSSVRMTIDASGNIQHGASATTIIDSSRNLTNIGTISSGAITADGNITADYNDTISLNYSVSNGAYHKGMTGTSFASGNTARGLHLFNFDNDSNLGINFWVGTNASKVFAGRIKENGNFGIGTDNPSDKLSLNGAVNASTGLTIGNNNSTRVRLYHSDAGGYSALTTDGMGTEQPLIIGSGQYLAFYTNGSERLRIDASGNIKHGASQTTIIDASRNLTNIGTISSGAITSTGAVTLSIDGTDALNFSANSTNDSRGISFNGRTALSADYNDGWLRINNQSEFGNGVYTPSNFRADGNVRGANFSVSTTTVIDSSRNLVNIGTISSGDITITGQSSGVEGGQINLLGVGSIEDIHIDNYDGTFRIFDGSAPQLRLSLDTSGNATFAGNVTAYSDERLKENIETLDSKKALQMRGVSFIKDGVKGSGVIAQEIEEIAPELVLTADDEMGTKSVAYGNLVGYLIETVKDQQKQIDELKQRLDNDS